MQRTKLGFVFLKVAMSLDSCSLYSWPTVRNMPLRVLKAPGISDMPETLSRPTMRSTERRDDRGNNRETRRRETSCEMRVGFKCVFECLTKLKLNACHKGEWIWPLSLRFLMRNKPGWVKHHKHTEWMQRERGMTEWSHKRPVKAWRYYTPWQKITNKQKLSVQWEAEAGQLFTLPVCSSEWKLCAMLQLHVCVSGGWRTLAVAVGMYFCDQKTKPNPCSKYPLLQYPWPTPGVPIQHYYTEGEKESSMTEHQVVRRQKDFFCFAHTNNSQNLHFRKV